MRSANATFLLAGWAPLILDNQLKSALDINLPRQGPSKIATVTKKNRKVQVLLGRKQDIGKAWTWSAAD